MMSVKNDLDSPLILGFVNDIYFSVRIESVAEQLGYRVRWVNRVDEFGSADFQPKGRQLGEHLMGRGAVLLDNITQWKPALIVFDLNNTAVPWREWIALLTSVPATRRIPVVCFGSHKDVDTMVAAREAGANAVFARSRFVSDLPDIIQRYVKVPDSEGLLAACQGELSPKAIQGLEEFNRGEYFEAHEHLEEAWMEDQSVGRDLYRAILQIAVAYHHIIGANYNGAMKMFLRVRQWIDPLPDICRGVDIARLREEAKVVHDRLRELGPEGIQNLDLRLLKPVQFVRNFSGHEG